MKIYLDACSIQRPLDDKTQLRVAIESEAIFGILFLIESGKIELISSEVLLFEASKISNVFRKDYNLGVLSKSNIFVKINNSIERRARDIIKMGINPLDALHLSSAENAKADYFCTCDDKLLKKARSIENIKVKIVTPLDLVKEIEK